jgi:hypothetical protein
MTSTRLLPPLPCEHDVALLPVHSRRYSATTEYISFVDGGPLTTTDKNNLASDIQAKLNALPNIGPNGVLVTIPLALAFNAANFEEGVRFQVEFVGIKVGGDVPLLQTSVSRVFGDSVSTITTTTQTPTAFTGSFSVTYVPTGVAGTNSPQVEGLRPGLFVAVFKSSSAVASQRRSESVGASTICCRLARRLRR